MAREELKLDAETSKAMEAMRNDSPVEVETTAPEPAPKPAETVVEKPSEPVKEEHTEQKTVPLPALQEAREALKEEKRRNEEIQKRTDERLRLLTEALTKAPTFEPKQDPAQMPDPEKDAMGALKMTQRQLAELQEYKRQQDAERESNMQRQHLGMRAAQLESEFMSVTPDYNEASQFLMTSRRNELMATGMYNPMQVNQVLQSEAQQLAAQAIQQGNNPAQIIYNIAKARGYSKAEVKAAVESGNLERVAAGQAASKSIGQAVGAQASSGAKLDGKTLANMPDAEFEKLYNKLSRGERAALMGN